MGGQRVGGRLRLAPGHGVPGRPDRAAGRRGRGRRLPAAAARPGPATSTPGRPLPAGRWPTAGFHPGRHPPGHRPARGAPGQGHRRRRAGRPWPCPPRARRGTGSAREAARIVADEVRPAMRRLLACLRDDLLPAARPDEQVGIRFVPGGDEGYRAAVRAAHHHRPDPRADPPDRPGRAWPGCSAEWAELGGRVLGHQRGAGDPGPAAGGPGPAVHRLRRRSSAPSPTRWTGPRPPATTGSRPTTSRDCVIEEIDPVEAGQRPLAYYRPPAAGGRAPARTAC